MFRVIRRIIRWTGDGKSRLFWGFLWSFISSLFIAMPIFGAAYILNSMILAEQGLFDLGPIWALYALFFIVASILGRFVFSYLRAVFQDSLAYEKSAEERIRIGDILKRVPLGFFSRNSTGKLSGTVTTSMSFFELYAMYMIDKVVNGYIMVAVMILCVAFFSWQAALISIAGVLLSALFLHLLGWRSSINAPAHEKAQDDMVGSIVEYVRGIPVVKAYGREGAAMDGLRQAFDEHCRINIKIELEYVVFNHLHQFALKVASVCVAVVVAYLYADGILALSLFLMLVIFSTTMFSQIETVQNAMHTLKNIDVIMDKFDEIKGAQFIDEEGSDITLDDYGIRFDRVSFGYDRSRRIIDDVSFQIPQNSTCAIIGPSGSGKTTLCNLIARFYDVDQGAISVGRHDIRTMTCDGLLSNISMVFQNVYLFNDTVRNNIAFGRPEASENDIRDAAARACCHEFIEALPRGYDTMVGEGGSTLSGGEKQRISLARALLKDAPIVILDEATASVDPENEHLIQEAISELSAGKTVVVIAHRLATIESADQILVVDGGSIVQKGRHDELIGQEGIYRRFIEIRQRAEGWSMA